MKCWKCMSEIPEGGRFCPVCGSDVNGEPGKAEDATAGKTENSADKKPVKKGIVSSLAWCAAAAILTAGAAFYMKSEPVEAVRDTIFYIKNRDFYRADLSGSQKKPEKCSDLFSDNAYESYYYGGLTNDFYAGEQYISKDGKTLYYPADMDYYSQEFTLYCQEEGKERVKIDRNVNYFKVTDDNKVVYTKKGDNLYLFDGAGRKKLAGGTNYFMVDETGKYVIWTTTNETRDGEDISAIFCQDLAMAEEKIDLGSEAQLIQASDDFSKILIREKNSLYLIENFGEPVKLVEDADEVSGADIEQNTFYFVKQPEEALTLMDYVEDDLKASDEAMKKPVRDDYLIDGKKDNDKKEDEYDTDWWNWDTEQVSSEYYEKLEAYEDKEKRDNIRRQLENEPAEFYKELYLYRGGEEILIDPHWMSFNYYLADNGKAGISYSRNTDVSVNKVKISELSDADSARYKIQSSNQSGDMNMVVVGDKTVELFEDNLTAGMMMSEDKQILYVLASEEEVSWNAENALTMYSVTLDPENFGQMAVVDKGVDVLECTVGTDAYYIKNVTNYQGDLYKNGSLVLKNVNEFSTVVVPDSTKIVCISNMETEKNWGTLNVIQNGEINAVADHVSYGDVVNENQIILMMDYNEDKSRGKLAYYDGEKLIDLDKDVFGIIPRGDEVECFSWPW